MRKSAVQKKHGPIGSIRLCGLLRAALFFAPLLLSGWLQPPFAEAVSFGPGEFQDPDSFLSSGQAPSDAGVRARLERAVQATVLIGGRGSGVLIHSEGWMITARHVIADAYAVGPTRQCQKIPLFLNHERDSEGRADAGLERLVCEEIRVNDYATDFVLMKVARLGARAGLPFEAAELERDSSALVAADLAYALGHPHASQFNEGVKKISVGPVIRVEATSPELPHFLHRIDTEGGSSGCAVLGPNGKLWGLHFRGVPDFSRGVEGVLHGQPQRFTRFNVALALSELAKRFENDWPRE